MRGYISILTPNVGAAIPSVGRTRLVGPNDGVSNFALTDKKEGPPKGGRKKMPSAAPGKYHGLDANAHIRK